MDYIEKLDLETNEVKEVENLEKHKIINNEPISVEEYEGHDRDFLALDGDYNDGFTQLNETNGLAINCLVSKRVNELRNSLDTMRPYKDKNINLGFNAYWADKGSDGKAVWVATQEQIRIQLDKIEGMVNQCALVIHISYVESENRFIILENLENLLYSIEYAKSKNIDVICLKFHCHITSAVIDKFGKDNFFNDYKGKLNSTMQMFKNTGIKYVVGFNELNFIYSNDEYKSNVIEVLNLIKNNGFKALITTNDMWDFNTLSDDIINMLDAYSVNLYPNISPKGENTTYKDSIYAWNKYTNFIKYLKSLGKEIIVSEFGCTDNWLALNATGGWSFDASYKSYGKAPAILLYGFLNSEIVEYIDSAWLWFYTNFYDYEEPKNIAINYVKGGK